MKAQIHGFGLVLMLALVQSGTAQEVQFSSQAFSLPLETKRVVAADFNNDQLEDLLAVLEDRLRIYFQDVDGFDFVNGYDEIIFEGQSVGWDISSGYGDTGSASVVALIDGRKVNIWQTNGSGFLDPTELDASFDGFLPKGINRLRFSQDVNNDGLDDLVVPGPGALNIHIQIPDTGYQPPLVIESDFRIRTNLVPQRLDRRIGQAVRIPTLELRDVNSDGSADLVSSTEEQLDVFLAQGNSEAYFTSQPSYSLDIAEIEERLGEFDIDNLDFSNLTGILSLTHEELLEDVDGDGIEDLLLREGGKVSLFGGTATDMNFETPRQVLRSGGNVLSTFLFDENNDGLKDLWLWRVEPISVGDIFVWLALSGSIAIEAFIYPNDGERFSRRPTRKITVDLKFPSVIRLTSAFRALDKDIVSAAESSDLLFAKATVGADSEARDLIAYTNQQLSIFFDTLEPQAESAEFLGALGYSRNRDVYEIDIRNVLDNARAQDTEERLIYENGVPDVAITNLELTQGSDILPIDLNGDHQDDIIIFETPSSGDIKGILLLSNGLSM